jgi:two-component system KDP operon response regulator KdpE
MTLRVLVVEDDREIRSLMQSSLSVEGFEVQTAVSLSEAGRCCVTARRTSSCSTSVCPMATAWNWSGLCAAHQSTPIIVVSARHQEAQKIQLLDAGADDYLTKPFSVGELLARIRVALRHRGTALAPAVTEHAWTTCGSTWRRTGVQRGGEPVHLTPTEFKLLARLVRSAGRVVTHRQLLADVWGPEFTEHTHYLRLYMGQLRAKIERDPAEPRHLLTETGVGYRLAARPDSAVLMRS